MIVTRLKLPLDQDEYNALLRAAGDELRNPIDQAHFILRQELARRGLLVLYTQANSEPTSVDILLRAQEIKHEGENVTS